MKLIVTINKKTKAKTIEYVDEPEEIDFQRFGMALADDFLNWLEKQQKDKLEPARM